MIQILAVKYPRHIASLLLLLFELSLLPAHASNETRRGPSFDQIDRMFTFHANEKRCTDAFPIKQIGTPYSGNVSSAKQAPSSFEQANIGGPSQPEMSSFKSVGADNMVNLFTGDFSYNIPLMDVGGYPINIFYDGGVSPEQEASWVGLGWNINPGTVSRNMRGIPDDFNGDDKLKQTQIMKPNNTWGFNMGYDMELVGVDFLEGIAQGSIGASVGYSYNNYLGPALDFGVHGSGNITLANKANSEKAPLSVGGGLGANVNSRNGLTISPHVSMTATAFRSDGGDKLGVGVRLGTSYNSRTGIKQLQLSEQMSYNYQVGKSGAERSYFGSSLSSTTISFAKPSYIPSLRMPVTNQSYSGRFETGTGMFGVKGSVEGDVYIQNSKIAAEDIEQEKPMVGYLYYQEAKNNPNAVMDFTRFNDNEVTNKTPVVSVPQYSYDVFSIQGEGTGGSIRAYRNDLGYVRDNTTRSKDISAGAGVDFGPGGHFGANFNGVKTPSYIGEWKAGNGLKNALQFKPADKEFENVYFKNPGETSVLNDDQYKRIGGTDMVRFKLGGTPANPIVEPVLEHFSNSNDLTSTLTPIGVETQQYSARKKRTQVTTILTAGEAAEIGLDKKIRHYDWINVLNGDKNLQSEPLERFYEKSEADADEEDSKYRRKHHISQINLTEASGRRYIYGVPVYNIKQVDYSFSVGDTDKDSDLASFTATDASINSDFVSSSKKTKDGFVQITSTPAYAHSFLLSGLLSPDYVDVKGDGITEDDLGDAVKFNYSLVGTHKWKTPTTSEDRKAHFNAGIRTETKDDKGIVTYGVRESWYLHSIESKTMIALFTLDDRKDGKGVSTEFGGININDNHQKKLKKIDLYSKSDLKKNGLVGPTAAKPIKTVWFSYNYSLCPGAPNNNKQQDVVDGKDLNEGKGKLTLEGIYFTFNGKNRTSKNKYVFSYTKNNKGNPSYSLNSSDRWGGYKNADDNPVYLEKGITKRLKNAAYPYTIQPETEQEKTKAGENAGAWALKTIMLPSGGQMEVEYESDDYAYVQNRHAARMMKVVGVGKTENAPLSGTIGNLYSFSGNTIEEHLYVFVQVPDVNGSAAALKKKYLDGVDQLAFKLSVNMPKGDEYIHCYASLDQTTEAFGIYTQAPNTIWIKLKTVDQRSPLTLAALDYLRERLPGQAFTSYDLSENTGLKQVVQMLKGMDEALANAFKDPIKYLQENGKAKTINTDRSFVRLNEPFGFKYGGGHRVKSVKLKDNWQAMTLQHTSVYGQEYDYKTTEVFDGVERTISSGVASYEPSIGGEENPFQQMLQIKEQLPLGPASYGSIEMPVLDAFFPAPVVGYSKVTVRSINKNTATHKSRSGIGKQVTEFYTAKDFPVQYSYTPLQPGVSDKTAHKEIPVGFFVNYSFDSRALSQGFLVVTNDMHGKMKSQASYAENDEKTPINYTQNFYRNTGKNGLEEFDFVYGLKGGVVKKGNMGVDIELTTDLREFSVSSLSDHLQAQADNIIPAIGWITPIWNTIASSDNIYRSVTTTKVINYHSILDKVVVVDKGSTVSTENIIYDAETGSVVVSKTNNEFNQAIYNVNYPAYWAYSGMGLAYKNINIQLEGMEFRDGKIVGLPDEKIKEYFESGDELYITDTGSQSSFCAASQSGTGRELWALDKNKNNSSLTNTSEDFVFIDKEGKLFSRVGVSFRIIRSGKRNMLAAPIASVSTIDYPVSTIDGEQKLVVATNHKVINATAAEYKEKWPTEKDNLKKYILIENPNVACSFIEEESCDGYLQKSINPYTKGLLGNFRTHRNMVFYEGRTEGYPFVQTNIKKNGFLNNFSLYWDFKDGDNLVPPQGDTKWVWNSEVTRVNTRGLELETKDALNVYTAAQYGFHKTLPLAITNNARYEEMFYEGFEDYSFKNSLNNTTADNCVDNKHIDIGASPVITDNLSFNAHTGKYVMAVSANSSISKDISIKQSHTTEFPINLETEVTKALSDPGGNYQVTNASPSNVLTFNINTYNLSGSHPKMNFILQPRDVITSNSNGPNTRFHSYSVSWYFYIEVTEAKTYNFTWGMGTAYNNVGATINSYSNGMAVYIRNSQGTIVSHPPTMIQNGNDYAGGTYNAFLCPGIYKVEGSMSELFSATDNGANYTTNSYLWECTNSNSLIYKSLTTQNGCTYTKPIVGDASMLNPTFSVQPDKKMLLSAWVKQDCGNTPCNNKISVSYNNANISQSFEPTGPVIEGWQRVEGVFTAPAVATTATLNFVNNSSSTIYFDDIRIHPFNSNMKSYVYDPINLRLTAELDANNYATFYEYDGEGTLVRTKVETKEGVKTINETRSFKQEKIVALQ